MGGEQIKVLVVDDSTVIRGMLAKVLEDDPAIKVVATAANGELALKHLSRMPVDVVTLDVEMPIMDGLTTLHEIVSKYPAIKVIMVSSKTEKGAKTTLDAMAAGAADFVPKPAANREGDSVRELRDELIAKIHTLSGVLPATAQQAATGNSAGAAPRRNRPANVRPEILVIGSSTGGPNALPVVLRGLSPDFKLPILIVQHMPPVFTRQLAIQLEDACGRPCTEARDNDPIEDGHIYVAPGDFHMVVRRGVNGAAFISINQDERENFCRPAVDPMFRSVARIYGNRVMAVILTGMGEDGRRGAEDVVAAGGMLVAQDEATSVVWGMPGAVVNAGLASSVLPLAEIGSFISQKCRVIESGKERL